MAEKKELQEKYEELFGKKAFGGWNEEQLQEKIDAFEEDKKPKKEEFKIDPNETYEFELIGKFASGKTYQIQQESKVWDEETKSIRRVRLAPFEDSPYVDEQREDTTVSSRPISFSYGKLNVKGTDAFKIKYLRALDSIEGKEKTLPENAGERNLFRMIDKVAKIDEELELEENKLKAKQVVAKAGETDLANFMRSRFGSETVKGKEPKQVKTEAYQKADENPSLFIVDFNNPKHKIKAQLQKAHEKGEITVADGEVSNKQGKSIYKFDAGRHAFDEAVARWVMEGSKEAKEFQSFIEDKS